MLVQRTFLILACMSLEALDAEALTRGTDMLGVCTSALPLPCAEGILQVPSSRHVKW